MLKACDPKAEWGVRAHAILTLMLDAGLRISEVTGLKTVDLNLWTGQACTDTATREASLT